MGSKSLHIKNNTWLILSACAIILVVGLSVWYDALPGAALLCLAVVVGVIAFALALTRPALLLYLLCFLIPFSQSIPAVRIAGRTLHIGFDTIVIGVIVLGYIARMMVVGNAKYVADKASIWLLIWWGWNLCMLGLTAARLSGMPRADAVIVFVRWSQYIPVFFLVLSMDLRSKQVKRLVKICVVASILMAGVTVLEVSVIGVDYTQIRGAALVTRGLFIEDDVANYNVSAAYLAIVTLLFAPFVLAANAWHKRLGTLIVVFLLTSIWLTTSRSGLFALIIGFVYLGVFYFPRTFVHYTVIFVPLGTAGLWFLKDTRAVRNLLKIRYIPQALPMLLGASLESLGLPPTAGGGVARLSLWGDTIRLFAQSPLWGHGFRATRWSLGPLAYFTADCYFLEILADTGIIGLMLALLFLGALYMSAIRLYRLARENIFLQKFSIGYLAALVGLMVVNLFGGMFMSQKIWGIFILLSAVLCNQLHVERKRRLAV